MAYTNRQSSAQPKSEKATEGDYIDFEEVKK